MGFFSPENLRTKQDGAMQDPEKIFADITRQQYDDFIKNFSGLEDTLVNRAKNDNRLVDQARVDTGKASGIAAGVNARNASRYGVALTPDQLKAQGSSLERSSALGSSDAINNARLTQRDLNEKLAFSLIDIGNGVNGSALGALGASAADANARNTAYNSAKTQSKMDTFSTIAGLGAGLAGFAAF